MFKLIRHSDYWFTRLLFQRTLAFIYFIAFLIAAFQFVPLLGENGLLPAVYYLDKLSFSKAPSIFWINASDTFFICIAWIGVALSLLALTGISERFNNAASAFIWALLWSLYLSFVNVGYLFYGFGWESLLCETGFLAIFLGCRKSKPPAILFWLMRWILFRVMFGAGLIKLRGDACWLNLTCMDYHYETQPVPGPLSWFFHHTPAFFHKAEVLFTHFTELVIPFGYFLIQPVAAIAGMITILFQFILILSGNLSWLNYMTIVVAIACLNDNVIGKLVKIKTPDLLPNTVARKICLTLLTGLILYLSISPAVNLFSKTQKMNASFDPLHLVNTYGAFGSITKVRHEIILEGTTDETISKETHWKEYAFKCKPGDVSQSPCFMSPYHYRLDWQMWFAAMSSYQYQPWILNLIAKLLQNDAAVTGLIRFNPFVETAPTFIRAELYRYRFTTAQERRETKDWWIRTRIRPYLPPLSLTDKEFTAILRRQGWLRD